MELTPRQLFERLVAILPGFGVYCQSPENALADDGSLTIYGVFIECSPYVRDQYERLTVEQKRRLGQFVEECMTPPGTDLDNAAATCFLENLTFERFSRDFEGFLDGEALDFYLRFQGLSAAERKAVKRQGGRGRGRRR
jgi:hypothetical protein